MSFVVTGGPALFLGEDDYVALVRPEIDPADPEVRQAAAQAGVTPEELAATSGTWTVLWERDGEGDGFELPGVRDAEPTAFAEQLRAELAAGSEKFAVDGGAALQLEGTSDGNGSWSLTARITPPGDEAVPLTVETGPLPADGLLADLDAFLEALA
ncbi:hypothetical protein H9Y04_39620 [Streptomyces sp. TRM66268-LWL]|uniref:Uncharacterized protein n=1 Tax=Streptomyces polyasparticus TaxID=2767826 RepID=A0ABR7STB5_9ACTN|nr:hypothetical protein [Streptomyces polyasparticus]MBC9718653.1 hypothetical protein [Streptomyces polyasparticus]